MWTKEHGHVAAPPRAEVEDDGRRLATLARANGEELRVAISHFNGFEFLNLRVWSRSPDGRLLPVKGKGLSLKTRELREVAAALLDAADELDGGGSQPQQRQAPPPRGQRPAAGPARPPAPQPSTDFDEFGQLG